MHFPYMAHVYMQSLAMQRNGKTEIQSVSQIYKSIKVLKASRETVMHMPKLISFQWPTWMMHITWLYWWMNTFKGRRNRNKGECESLPGDGESAWKTRCKEWSTEIATKLMLCTHWSKPLELSTSVCPPISCFLAAGCPKPPFIKPVALAWGLYKGLGEVGRVLSWIKLISCCCKDVLLLLAGIPSRIDRRSCKGHFFTSEPPTELMAFCHSVYNPNTQKNFNSKIRNKYIKYNLQSSWKCFPHMNQTDLIRNS